MPNIDYTLRLRDFFSNKLKGAVSETKRLDFAMLGVGRSMSKVQAGMVGRFGLAALAVGGLAALTAGVVSFGRGSLEALKNYEFFSVTLRTLMKGDAAAAKALQGQLVQLARVTPFSLQEVQRGSTQLLATGGRPGEIIKELRMLGDVAAGVNVPLNQLIKNFGQVRARGFLIGRDMNDFMTAGVQLAPILARNMGVAESKIADMISGKQIGFNDVAKAFETMTAKGGLFFNLMNEQSKTVGGRLSNLGDSWTQLQLQSARSQRGMIFDAVTWAEKLVGSTEESMRAINDLEQTFRDFKVPQLEEKSLGEQILNVLIPAAGLADELTEDEQEKRKAGLLKRQATIDRKFGASAKSGNIVAAFGEKVQLETQLKSLQREFNTAEKARLDFRTELKGASNVFERKFLEHNFKEIEGLTARDFELRRAVLLAGISRFEGLLSNLKGAGEIRKKFAEGDAADEGLGTGVGISGRRPQNINITINKLVETIEIHSETLPEAADEIQDEVAKTLLEAVNDVNSIAK